MRRKPLSFLSRLFCQLLFGRSFCVGGMLPGNLFMMATNEPAGVNCTENDGLSQDGAHESRNFRSMD